MLFYVIIIIISVLLPEDQSNLIFAFSLPTTAQSSQIMTILILTSFYLTFESHRKYNTVYTQVDLGNLFIYNVFIISVFMAAYLYMTLLVISFLEKYDPVMGKLLSMKDRTITYLSSDMHELINVLFNSVRDGIIKCIKVNFFL